MKWLALPCLLSAACASTPAPVPAPTPDAPVDRAVSDAERSTLAALKLRTEAVRGHAFTQDFEVRVVNTLGMRTRLRTAVREPDEHEVGERRLLEALALLPEGYALDLNAVHHAEAEMGGTYVRETGTLLLLEGSLDASDVRSNDAMFSQLAVVHELAHALQDDRSFPSDGFAARERTLDERLVRSALAEGDASFAMLVAYARATGVDATRLANNPRGLALLARYSVERVRAGYDAPALLRNAITASYAYGSAFVARRFVAGGWDAVDAMHVTPPDAMEQLIHPERTGNTVQRDVLDAEDLAGFDAVIEDLGYSLAHCDRLGELGMRALFEGVSGAVTSETAADGWNGDEACVYAQEDAEDVAALVTTWDSIRDAVEAAEAFRQVARRLAPLGRNVHVARVQRVVLVTYDIEDEAQADMHDELHHFAHYVLSGTAAPSPSRR